ncbi:MAG: uracil-DNA glycosylase [Luminiphilus sp.]|jgi:uracil-DNA glycosylase|nr:uracil-DNA glycosylase [Luminiphilus sp.]
MRESSRVNGQVRLRSEWLDLLGREFEQPYMANLRSFLRAEKAAGKVIYPRGEAVFAALDQTPPASVRVVILGQDPYHGPGQAHGLSFSVKRGVRIPPSLQNIFRELQSDLRIALPSHGDLTAWARQGVLLLNTVLSVEHGQAGAHQGQGWEIFTDAVVSAINDSDQPIVFMLWGAHAQRKGAAIHSARHCVLRAPHPSPLSAHRGFLGCRHFSQANAFLTAHGRQPVDWSLAE